MCDVCRHVWCAWGVCVCVMCVVCMYVCVCVVCMGVCVCVMCVVCMCVCVLVCALCVWHVWAVESGLRRALGTASRA